MRGRGFARRVGLLGGSFNPAHAGHRHVAEVALRALRLHEVWLLVSPGNPLKPEAGMAAFAERLASARRVAAPPRIRASALEQRLRTALTWRSLSRIRRLWPRARFVFLIGADNLLQLPRWRRWRRIIRLVPIAVLPRPGYVRAALRGQAAAVLRHARRRPAQLLAPPLATPRWCFVPARMHAASATAIRAARAEEGSRHGRGQGQQDQGA
ncbi:MAG: nicotinate-nucleotide adenylyltransferase [Rhodovarius sp.]|nr:nicotinate-nucleotide adenylyltransferase [Rhodovarius sp.]MCX7931722.1 nicotinate-nucleotide adenylyltransferase [Rhodovarius sp.]